MRRITLTAAVCAMALAASPAAVGADEPQRPEGRAGSAKQSSDAPAKPAATDEKPLRFTNDDLPPLHPSQRGAAAETADREGGEAKEPETASDLSAAMDELQRQAIEDRIAAVRRRIAELEAQLGTQRSRLRSLQNPLLRGVTPASEEEEEAVGGLPNDAQQQWLEEQIAATEAAIEEARAELVRLLRR